MALKDGLVSLEELSSTFSGATVQATTGTFSTLSSANGGVLSASLGSPGNFGAFIQAGSLGTSAGSAGFLALRTPYTTTDYVVDVFPFSGTSVQAFASGVQNATSGVNI